MSIELRPDEQEAFDRLFEMAEPELAKAVRSGHFMLAVVSLNGAELDYWVRQNDFFREDVELAIELIREGTQNHLMVRK